MKAAIIGAMVWILVWLLSVISYGAHIFYTIFSFTGEGVESIAKALFLIAGVMVPPLGTIHGMGVVFGLW